MTVKHFSCNKILLSSVWSRIVNGLKINGSQNSSHKTNYHRLLANQFNDDCYWTGLLVIEHLQSSGSSNSAKSSSKLAPQTVFKSHRKATAMSHKQYNGTSNCERRKAKIILNQRSRRKINLTAPDVSNALFMKRCYLIDFSQLTT